MVAVNDSDVEFGHDLAEGLIEGRVDDRLEITTFRDERVGIVVSDVQQDYEDFRRDLEVAGTLGIELPALYVQDSDHPIVIALSLFLPQGWMPELQFWQFIRERPTYRYAPIRAYRDALARAIESSSMELGTLDLESATNRVREGIVEHLSVRAAAFREFLAGAWLPPVLLRLRQSRSSSTVATPGANFYVSSASFGLRVHWSGAYRISANYFGSPTSPVAGVLQAGRYKFGVDGGAYGTSIQWDHNAVVTLPGNNSVQLYF